MRRGGGWPPTGGAHAPLPEANTTMSTLAKTSMSKVRESIADLADDAPLHLISERSGNHYKD
jgi:hypothetical protein